MIIMGKVLKIRGKYVYIHWNNLFPQAIHLNFTGLFIISPTFLYVSNPIKSCSGLHQKSQVSLNPHQVRIDAVFSSLFISHLAVNRQERNVLPKSNFASGFYLWSESHYEWVKFLQQKSFNMHELLFFVN